MGVHCARRCAGALVSVCVARVLRVACLSMLTVACVRPVSLFLASDHVAHTATATGACSRDAVSPAQLQHFNTAGRFFARAIAEGDVVDVTLARFMLRRLSGRAPCPHDLRTVDAGLHAQLAWVLSHSIKDVLFLSFSVEINERPAGDTEGKSAADAAETRPRVVELCPGGAAREVTDANKAEYAELLVKYKLHLELEGQLQAFIRGFSDVIDPHDTRLLSPAELSLLLSGRGDIDLTDMRRHVRFTMGYTATSVTVLHLWKCLSEWDPADVSRLMQFITGAARCPPGGFASLDPPLTIQRVTGRSASRHAAAVVDVAHLNLPSASTCFNLLKLPDYEDADVLASKLLLAVREAATGFAFS